MDRHPLRYAVNLSMLFTELDVLDRPKAAAAAGFDAIEFWWPFDRAVPELSEVDAFVRAVEDAGVRLVGLNFFAGDMPGGDRGLVSWPDRAEEFRSGVELAVRIAERLGCRAFNALYGNRISGADPDAQDELAVRNLTFAAKEAERIGATVLIEPVSGAPDYPLRTAGDALAVIDRVRGDSGADNLGLLADLYHLAVNGDDVAEVIRVHSGRISHVQLADAPGRGAPGTGELDIPEHLDALAGHGYRGYVGLEYKPGGTTTDSLDWLPREARAGEPEGNGGTR